MEIRNATPRDIPRVHEIERRVFPSPWGPEFFHYTLETEPGLFLVAAEGDEVTGYTVGGIEWMRLAGSARVVGHIKNVAVTERWRRRGVGSMLMDELEARFVVQGAELAYLEVRESNHVAQEMYGGRGYRVIERIEGYYGDENALVMALELGGGSLV